MKQVKGIIFDVDGTLLDSMGIWEDVGVRYLKSIGVEPEANLGAILYPMTIEEASEYVQKKYRLTQSIPEIIQGVLDIVKDFYYEEAPLKEGVRELLELFYERKIPMVVATTSVRDHMEHAFRRLKIDHYFEEIFTSQEVGEGKSSPLIYEKAAGKLGFKPGEICVFEDALYALETAKQAGFLTVGVYDSFSCKDRHPGEAEAQENQLAAKADVFLKSMKQLDLLKKFFAW